MNVTLTTGHPFYVPVQVEYGLEGRYYPATREEPAEYPELVIYDIQVIHEDGTYYSADCKAYIADTERLEQDVANALYKAIEPLALPHREWDDYDASDEADGY